MNAGGVLVVEVGAEELPVAVATGTEKVWKPPDGPGTTRVVLELAMAPPAAVEADE